MAATFTRLLADVQGEGATFLAGYTGAARGWR
jgi:hypothetical protein